MNKSHLFPKLFWVIMKITLQQLVICLVFCTFSHAHSAYSQFDLSKTISLQMEKAEIKKVLSTIEKQVNVKFVYSSSNINMSQVVNINVTKKRLDQLLNELLLPMAVEYLVKENRIILRSNQEGSTNLPNVNQSKVVDKLITGKIKDELGQGLPGVNVSLKGTTKGTQTDSNGNFSLTVPENNAYLLISFVGYSSQEVSVGDKSILEVSLKPDVTSLNEVVVVGYGTTQKVNLTGSISTIKFDEKINNRPLTNASQALGGTASGVWVSQNSGKPGGDGSQIRIRGWGTLNNANPLIIVDGVEGTFEQLNPADIESVSVLKDAASAAIYGSKAANGVVLITTKMGKNNEKMQVNVNSYAGVQFLGMRYKTINNSADNMELSNRALVNDGASPLYSSDLINAFRTSTDNFKYPNTNWFSELFKPARIQEHNVSIRGGSSQTSTFLSFNYLNQEGMVANTNSQRFSLRANVDSKINNWLKISGRVSYINRLSKEPYADITYGSLGRVFDMLSGAAPFIAPYARDGRFGSVQATDKNGALLYDNRNPLIDAANGQTSSQENLLSINATAEVNFTKHLSVKTTFAANGTWNLVDRYNSSVFGYTDSGIETITKNFNREGLEINRGTISGFNTNLFSTLNYNNTFNIVHEVSAIAGTQIESNKIQTLYARRSSPPKEGLTQVDAGTSGIQGSGNMNALRILSYFGRLNYAFNQKYLFEANFRADASSRFKDGNRWGYFPGFSAGWRVSDEEFLKNSDVISNLKLRASWGRLGNQNISDYWPYLTIINQNNALSYNYGGKLAPGAAVTNLIDENITWEKTSTTDIGIEMSFLKNKISIEADYFAKKTEDILVQLPIPLVLGGLNSPFENKGEMTNNGVELIFNYNNLVLDRNKLGFNIGLNVTYIDNMVTKFGTSRSPDQLYLIREGYSFRELYGYKVVGIYQTDQEASEHMFANGFKPKAGNLKFEDVNKDGKLGFEDKQSIGNTIPKVTFGISPSFKFKGFDLNILMQGILGVNMFNQNNFTNLTYENRVIGERWLNSWTPTNTNTNIPMARFDNSWNSSQSSFWVNKVDFVKLKNIQLGYSVPEKLSNKYGLKKAYIYVNAQNMYTLVSNEFDGYDPEKNTFDSSVNQYPVPRIVTLGVNLNF